MRTNNGRIAVYLHRSRVGVPIGGTLIEILCDSDFGAATDECARFADTAARLAHGIGAKRWSDVVAGYPDVDPSPELQRIALSKALKERISIGRIVNLTLDDAERQ